MKRKSGRRAADPFLRPCPACVARIGEPCVAVGKDGKPVAMKATRLVHADRIESLGATNA